ncbi:MAG: mucoidy inhibitor MuiA family protein [Deltaproteobacteria bacterium]|nr:mucoidy inhibitor MuiA family protein [Deltaproteobacteria bacterium]
MVASYLAALILAAAVDAPVTSVEVFSDRARVTRLANVTLGASEKVELPLLLDTVDPATVRLTAKNAEVRRVELARVEAQDFPKTEAKKLLDALDALDDAIRQTEGERGAAQAVLEVLNRVRPTLPPSEPGKPQPHLTPASWTSSLNFGRTYREKLQTRIRAASIKLEDQNRERQKLLAEAAKLQAERHGGWRVTATVAGSGPAQLALTYMVSNARWYPSYDLTLLPDRAQVMVSFAALVSQESGEDWDNARLTVSTAVPASATTFPKLRTWKIGEKERFIPTPSPAAEFIPPAPPAVPPLAMADTDTNLLLRRLAQRAGTADYRFKDNGKNGAIGQTRGGETGIELDRDGDGILDQEDDLKKAAPAEKPKPPPPPPAMTARPPESAPAAPSPVMMDEVMEEREATVSGGFARGESADKYVPTVQFGLAPPPGYVAPSYAANLPAALAGGYDLAFDSVQPETVPSGKGARHVALFAVAWPVTVERKLYPALAPEAFLVAELKNPQSNALPGGEANLYVGADPAGTAHLGFVAPGEEFTLPLGLDRAIKPVRNVKLVQAEKGIIGKDEVNQYDVTIEVANPYGVPVSVKTFDQWPVTDDEHVEVKLLSTAPYAKQDPVKGSLEWDVVLPPHGKTTLAFSYSLRHPKDTRLHQ